MRHLTSFVQLSAILEKEQVSSEIKKNVEEIQKMIGELDKKGVDTKTWDGKEEILKAILSSEFDIEEAKTKVEESVDRPYYRYPKLNEESGDGYTGLVIEVLEHSEMGSHFKSKYGNTWWSKLINWLLKVLTMPLTAIQYIVGWICRKLGMSFESTQVSIYVVFGLMAGAFVFLAVKALGAVVLKLIEAFSISNFLGLIKTGFSLNTMKSSMITFMKSTISAASAGAKLTSSATTLYKKFKKTKKEIMDKNLTINDLLDNIEKGRKQFNIKAPKIEFSVKMQIDKWISADEETNHKIAHELADSMRKLLEDKSFDAKTPITNALSRIQDKEVKMKLQELMLPFAVNKFKPKVLSMQKKNLRLGSTTNRDRNRINRIKI